MTSDKDEETNIEEYTNECSESGEFEVEDINMESENKEDRDEAYCS